jgi:peptide/nickel transport system permease protein
VLPLAAPSAAVSLFYLFPEIIGIDAILTLFGLGPKPPTPSLGGLVFEGIRRWDSAPWLAGCPCLILIFLCLGMHFLADRIAEQVNLGSRHT